MELFRAEIKTNKEAAKYVLDLMEAADLEEMVVGGIPVSAISEFIDNKRSTLWEITVNGNTVMQVTATKKSAKAMVEMLKEEGVEVLPIVPIPIENLVEFVQGKRKNVLTIQMAHHGPGEELPGHVK